MTNPTCTNVGKRVFNSSRNLCDVFADNLQTMLYIYSNLVVIDGVNGNNLMAIHATT